MKNSTPKGAIFKADFGSLSVVSLYLPSGFQFLTGGKLQSPFMDLFIHHGRLRASGAARHRLWRLEPIATRPST